MRTPFFFARGDDRKTIKVMLVLCFKGACDTGKLRESAKLRAPRALVPYLSRAPRASCLSCSCASRVLYPTCILVPS